MLVSASVSVLIDIEVEQNALAGTQHPVEDGEALVTLPFALPSCPQRAYRLSQQ